MAKNSPRFKNLYDAVTIGMVADVRELLAAGADPNEIKEAGDVTPLMAAASYGDLSMVQALVEAGANVNALAEDFSGELDELHFIDIAYQRGELHGMTALLYTVIHRHPKVRHYLEKLTSPELLAQAKAVERRVRQIEPD
jgi:ankyrin repeat protein